MRPLGELLRAIPEMFGRHDQEPVRRHAIRYEVHELLGIVIIRKPTDPSRVARLQGVLDGQRSRATTLREQLAGFPDIDTLGIPFETRGKVIDLRIEEQARGDEADMIERLLRDGEIHPRQILADKYGGRTPSFKNPDHIESFRRSVEKIAELSGEYTMQGDIEYRGGVRYVPYVPGMR